LKARKRFRAFKIKIQRNGVLMKTENAYVAFFDLDQTILETSSGLHMVRSMKERNLLTMGHRMRFLRAVIPYRLGLITSHRAMEIISLMFKGASLEDTLAHNDFLFENYLAGDIRPAAVEELAMHKKQGGRTVLLSASTNFVCSRMAEHLGMDDIVTTEVEVKDGILTGGLSRRYCHGTEKVVRAQEYCREKNFSLENAWYYGDAWADHYILEAVGNPRCVTPESRLRKKARALSWPVLEWGLEATQPR